MGEKREGYKILNGDCLEWLDKYSERDIHLTFWSVEKTPLIAEQRRLF